MPPKQRQVPKQSIVQGPPAFLSQEDLVFTKDGIPADALSFVGSAFLNAGFGSGAVYGDASAVAAVIEPAEPVLTEETPTIVIDVPSLADIESVEFEEYADPLTGIAKYKAVLKIRNSSVEKNNISGVDARIYSVNGSVPYTIQKGTATSGVNVPVSPSFTPTVTWYQASGRFNPFSGTIVSNASAGSSASYPADGSGVPADVSSGSYTVRTYTAWRKTQQEALNAVNEYMRKIL